MIFKRKLNEERCMVCGEKDLRLPNLVIFVFESKCEICGSPNLYMHEIDAALFQTLSTKEQKKVSLVIRKELVAEARKELRLHAKYMEKKYGVVFPGELK